MESQRDNTGKRYMRELEPHEYRIPWWLLIYCAAILYFIFA